MNSPLEQYIGDLERGLQDLSETRRKEELTEVRQHLEASVKFYKELGLDETTAIEEAVRQFGAARKVSGGLRKAYWREKVFVPDTLWGAALIAVCASLVLENVLGQFAQVFYFGLGLRPDVYTLTGWLMWLLSRTPTILAGYLVGRIAPRHGFIGTIVGKSLYAAYGITLYLLMWALANYRQPNWMFAGKAMWEILTMTLLIVPLSAIGAYFGSRHAKASLRRV